MNTMQALVANPFIAVMFASILLAQMLKVPWYWLRTQRVDWSLLWSASGMPSSHSAAVTSVMIMVGLRSGFDSLLFGVVAMIGMIVMYDARGVRRAAGEQAEALNYLLDLGAKIDHRKHTLLLEQRLGHTSWQVLGGALLGAALAVLLNPML